VDDRYNVIDLPEQRKVPFQIRPEKLKPVSTLNTRPNRTTYPGLGWHLFFEATK